MEPTKQNIDETPAPKKLSKTQMKKIAKKQKRDAEKARKLAERLAKSGGQPQKKKLDSLDVHEYYKLRK